jgi:hypothetical protein
MDVSEHTDVIISKTQKRPDITYLSWSKAWALLKNKFPGSTYAHRDDLHHTDGTVEVEVDVVIQGNSGDTQFTNARLGVMDQRFNPIPEPTARQINDTRQRTLVKALAFAGLGLNLWGGSDIPVGKLDDPITPEEHDILLDLIEATETDMESFMGWCESTDLMMIQYPKFVSARNLLEARKRRQEKEAEESDDA